MLSKYRMEKANPGMEKARLTSRLNAVQQRIKEVEEQLDEARRNAAFESKYKNDPYWKIAKKRYIETGDPAAIENFRAKQDALEEAEKNRIIRNNALQEQQRQQSIYDELDARRDVQNAVVDYDVAYASGDEVAQDKAKNALNYAKEHYMQVTGKEYKLPPKYNLEDTKEEQGQDGAGRNEAQGQDGAGRNEAQGQDGAGRNEEHAASNWLRDAPLFAESGAKNAKEYAAYLLKYADNADGKFNKMRLSAANKQLVDNFLAANKDRWADMGINDQDVARIKSHLSQEDYDARVEAYNRKRRAAIQNWNSLMDDKNATYAQKQAAYAELAKYGIKPETTSSKVKLEKE